MIIHPFELPCEQVAGNIPFLDFFEIRALRREDQNKMGCEGGFFSVELALVKIGQVIL
jgi:hypothetical protein